MSRTPGGIIGNCSSGGWARAPHPAPDLLHERPEPIAWTAPLEAAHWHQSDRIKWTSEEFVRGRVEPLNTIVEREGVNE